MSILNHVRPILVLLVLIGLTSTAFGRSELVESDLTPFPLAIDRHMSLDLLTIESQAGYKFAEVFPSSVVSMEILQVGWPKGGTSAAICVAQSSAGIGLDQKIESHIAVLMEGNEPYVYPLDELSASGFISRICIWPTRNASDADVIVLMSFSWGWEDSSIRAFRITATGDVTPVDTGGANTLYGWFDAVDLDDNGTFELITSRNLDGTMGGFFYHAVREYQASTGSYVANPDGYLAYFQHELDWLDWVIDTRAQIQADPEPFMDQTGAGHIYKAVYEGVTYGFDTIVEVPESAAEADRIRDYNNLRRTAFDLVKAYRDELSAWLGGGEYPATWRMTR